MLRAVLAAFAALAMSACSYGSAVDIAPFKDRSDKAILADGDYCKLAMKEKPYQVTTGEDCVRFKFDPASRTYHMTEIKGPVAAPKAEGEPSAKVSDDAPEEITAAVVPLGGGLYAAQVEMSAEDKANADGPDIYQINLFVVSGDAMNGLPVLGDDELIALAKKHKRLKFGEMPPANSTDLWNKRPWIAEGSISDIKTFLRAAAREGVRGMTADDWADFSVGIRDSEASPAHPATAAQIKDAEAVRKMFDRLK